MNSVKPYKITLSLNNGDIFDLLTEDTLVEHIVLSEIRKQLCEQQPKVETYLPDVIPRDSDYYERD